MAGIDVRSIVVPDDVADWLTLRDRAMAGQTPPARPWTATDFRTEMMDKPWWRADRSWLAAPREAPQHLVGAVTLALRNGEKGCLPVLHWLLVDPTWRRRGVGRLLLTLLEQAAWDAGWREVELETHAGWADAIAFYHSMGYGPVRDPSPR